MSDFVDRTKLYRDFFVESDAGKALLKDIQLMILAEHKSAETATDPHSSFAYTQRAKGVREVLNKINGLTMEANKTNH